MILQKIIYGIIDFVDCVLKYFSIFLIKIYQLTISPDKGIFSSIFKWKVCIHEPHCSEYSLRVLKRYGFFRWIIKVMDRVTSCTWWSCKKYDPEYYKVVFMSSAPIGVPFLQQLNNDKRFDIVWVVTNPDEKSGRWMKCRENIIKSTAKEVLGGKSPQPPFIKGGLCDEKIRKYSTFSFQDNESYIKDNKLISNGKHLPYNPDLKERARVLRKNMTNTEKLIWKNYFQKLSINVLRQKPIDQYIVDFYIPSCKLVVEIDWLIHDGEIRKKYDKNRDDVLRQYDLQILRIDNSDIEDNFKETIQKIQSVIDNSPSLLKRGLGGDLLKPTKVLILDWLWGDGNSNWIPWIKEQFENMGMEVKNPKLPNNDNPDLQIQLDFLQYNVWEWIDEETMIVCHSLGALLSNHLIAKLDKKINSLVHIWPAFSENDQSELIEKYEFIKKAEKGLNLFHNTKIDYKKVQDLVWKFYVFLSKTDEYIPYRQAKEYYETNFSKAEITVFEDKWHFNKPSWVLSLEEFFDIIKIEQNFVQTPRSLRLDSKKYWNDATKFQEWLKSKQADFLVVIAYGKIVPKNILDLARFAPINIHGSLLPKYRGASPIQSVFLNEEKETWVTIMKMDEWLDTGNMIDKQKFKINFDWTVKDIIQKFQEKWPTFLCNVLWDYGKWLLWEEKQGADFTECGKIEKEDWKVDLYKDNVGEVYKKYRAYCLRPKIYFEFEHKNGKQMLATIDLLELDEKLFDKNKSATFIEDWKLNEAIIQIKIKPEWKKSMDWESFVNGYLK